VTSGGAAHRHVVRAKLVPEPWREGLVARPRVLAHLSPDVRFTLVSAMPGYGKTAAVRQWIDTVDVPVAWWSLDLLDAESISFWSNLLLAIGTAVPGIDDEPSKLLFERGVDDHLFLAALVAGLVDAQRPLLLVLDGLDSELDRERLDGISLLVERAGDVLRMVVTTRSDPALPLARWRARGWLQELREDTLRLTDDEALAIAGAAATELRAPDELIALNHRVDGWPIGFGMALLARPTGRDPHGAPDFSLGSSRLLADYLVGEVLASMSDEERSVALALSVLESFDPDLCTALVGEHAAATVRKLLRRGMFLSVIDPRVGRMRFHDLFRELMEMELGWRDPAARLDLHRRAAMIWRDRGDLLSAYHHLAVIGETAKADDLLVGPVLELVDEGRLDDLRQFARQLPTPQHVTSAALALDLARVSLYTDGTTAARRWSARAEALATSETASPGCEQVLRGLQALRCVIALLDADLDGALAGIETHGRAATATSSSFEERLPIVAARVMLAMRRREDADEWITAAERIPGPEIVTCVTVPTLRAWHEWMFGSLPAAVELMDGALKWMAEHRTGPHHLAFDALITGGWCRLSVGDFREATRLAERASSDAEVLGCAWNHLQVSYLTARLAHVTGDPSRVLKIVDEARAADALDGCRLFADRLLAVEAEALAATGRPAEARRAIEALGPGPRTELLRARFEARSDREVAALLADRAAWPVVERLQAELVLTTRLNSSSPSDELRTLIADAGASGWVLPFLGLGAGVERLMRSAPIDHVHPNLARALEYLAPPARGDDGSGAGIRLTSRELTLLELLPTHLSYADMGERLFLSVNTVKSNLKALYRKLGVTTRAEAVEVSRRVSLV
jgi:LuxR family maltose regulon positive regulatory protein